MTALLLSDSELLLHYLRQALAPAGHTVERLDPRQIWTQTLSRTGAGAELEPAASRNTNGPSLPDVVLLAVGQGGQVVDELFTSWESAPPPLLLLSPDPADTDAAQEVGALFVLLPAPAQELLAALAVVTRRRKLVLLCDDSTLIHRHTAPILREAGFDVAHAYDGAEALVRQAELRPDLVITDVEMPRLDGYGLCQALKGRQPHLPVLMCSTLGEAQSVERGFDAGADDYVVKPAQQEDLVARVRTLLKGRSAGGGGTRERVLVVDDSQLVRQMVTGALRRQGFLVISASDGEAGLARAQRDRPALIVTDYDMPRMSGFEMVHALRRGPDTQHIPVVMLTARDRRRDERQMKAVGVDAYLVKPFSMDRCAALCERVLAERRLRAYQQASRLYISHAAARAAEQAADQVAMTGASLAVRAEEREVAVLFSDVSGFTALSAARPPREVVDLLNSCFDVLCPVVMEEGGDIDKFIGDAIMAVFDEVPPRPEAPEAGVDLGTAPPLPAALRAVRAGLRMQEALAAWRVRTGHGLQMRVGINTGKVVRGDIGSRHVRRDYTVIGDVVNRAQRLESSAPIGGVLIGATTYAVVAGSIRCEPRPGLRLKGVDQLVDAFVALGFFPDSRPDLGPVQGEPGFPESVTLATPAEGEPV